MPGWASLSLGSPPTGSVACTLWRWLALLGTPTAIEAAPCRVRAAAA